jgi:hypothetical protein
MAAADEQQQQQQARSMKLFHLLEFAFPAVLHNREPSIMPATIVIILIRHHHLHHRRDVLIDLSIVQQPRHIAPQLMGLLLRSRSNKHVWPKLLCAPIWWWVHTPNHRAQSTLAL